MPLIINANYALVRLDFSRTGSLQRQVITFGVRDTAGSLSAAQIATAVNTAWGSAGSLRTLQNPLTSHVNTHVIRGSVGPPTVADANGTGAGTATAGALAPPAVCPIISKLTGFGGRQYRGRFYFPDIKESSVDDGGLILGSALTSYQAAADAFLAALGTANIPMYLLHTSDIGATAVQSLLVRSFVGTQRGRQARS